MMHFTHDTKCAKHIAFQQVLLKYTAYFYPSGFKVKMEM
jgi:hypothetical protein